MCIMFVYLILVDLLDTFLFMNYDFILQKNREGKKKKKVDSNSTWFQKKKYGQTTNFSWYSCQLSMETFILPIIWIGICSLLYPHGNFSFHDMVVAVPHNIFLTLFLCSYALLNLCLISCHVPTVTWIWHDYIAILQFDVSLVALLVSASLN